MNTAEKVEDFRLIAHRIAPRFVRTMQSIEDCQYDGTETSNLGPSTGGSGSDDPDPGTYTATERGALLGLTHDEAVGFKREVTKAVDRIHRDIRLIERVVMQMHPHRGGAEDAKLATVKATHCISCYRINNHIAPVHKSFAGLELCKWCGRNRHKYGDGRMPDEGAVRAHINGRVTATVAARLNHDGKCPTCGHDLTQSEPKPKRGWRSTPIGAS